jgi:PKD repeat protein
MKKFALISIVCLSFCALFTSCQKDPPTCDFTYTAAGLSVSFTAVATNTDTYAWDFGDSQTSTEANPVHSYTGGGDYDVKLKVTGEGGTAEKKIKVTVSPNAEDIKVMLTGGPSATNGKTWVLKTSSITDGDGASAVEPSMLVLIPTPADFYSWLGRERLDGKKDEYTFKYNGSYTITTKNDTSIAMSIFAFANGITVPNSNGPYGTCRAAGYVQPAGATWTLNETDITVDAITDPSTTAVPPVHSNKTFSGKKWISLSTGSFFGFRDFSTSSNIIIKSISPTEMRIALMVCIYQGAVAPGGIAYANLPTHIYHMTFVPKP